MVYLYLFFREKKNRGSIHEVLLWTYCSLSICIYFLKGGLLIRYNILISGGFQQPELVQFYVD